ncbi:Na/Pi symporter [Piscibacillus sp. B03]|uniref:Na/Pi symporter n=1 Tax=Piscibacillus sp. B03 TaxID=3457430 RepID=UPI003FCD06FE
MIYVISFLILMVLTVIGTRLIGSSSIVNSFSNTFRTSLLKLINKPWKGLILGLVATIIIQNGAVMILITVGFVAARFIRFPQSIGIILGINIGSSISIDVFSINPSHVTVLLIFVGTLLCFIKFKKVLSVGYSFMGVFMVISSLWLMDLLAIGVREATFFHNPLDESSINALLTGIVHTLLGQSNSTIHDLTLLIMSGDIERGIPLIAGANIGIAVTSVIASLATMREARLTAYAYLWLNILGALFIFPLLDYVLDLGSILTPTQFNIFYNTVMSLIALSFVKPYTRFIITIYYWRQKHPHS